MQSSSSPSVSLPDSISETNQFNVTILDNRILLVRLATELDRLLQELRWAIDQLRQDPAGFTRVIASNAVFAIRRQLTPTNLVGLTSALLVISSLALLVAMFERRHPPRSTEVFTEETERPLLLVVTDTSGRGRTSIYPPSTGRVGMSSGRGEGSSPVPAHAQGGGSGGDRDLLPEQVGKVPQPSEVPAVIPTEPPKYSPSLPAAGVDLDPKLWADVTFPVYGNPYSHSTLKSHGPGENGGIGTNSGFGVGSGRGNGFGDGNDGNTGGGNRQIGYGEGGGAAGGGIGSDGNTKPGYGGGGYDQRVRLLLKPEPHYTEEARRQGTVGTVILRVVFSSTGEITQIRAINGLPFGLTERAIAAARAIKFVPAMKNGQPVSVFMQLEYNFNLY